MNYMLAKDRIVGGDNPRARLKVSFLSLVVVERL